MKNRKIIVTRSSLTNAFRSLYLNQNGEIAVKPSRLISRQEAKGDIIYREDKRKQGKKFRIGFYVATLVVIFGALTMLFPYLWMALTSFKSNNEAFFAPPTFFPTEWITSAYEGLVADPKFYTSILWTLLLEVSVIGIGTLVSTLAAFAFAKLKFKGSNFLFLMQLVTIMIPMATMTIPSFIF